ncbi:MAG: hypothetical protein GY805_00845, partial [Chloroflexi bacterium]|nr:hypothetical protein [Chloroflexota bacterium]
MEKVTNPIGRVFIHLALILFAIYSIVPFFWTALQSFKTLKDANSRTPLIFFTPTWDNYTDLWLRSIPENGSTIGYFILATVIVLIGLLLFARYMPVRPSFVYAFV